MVCPKRKDLMICRIIQSKETKKNEKKEEKIITKEEHQKRMEKLKEMGFKL